MMASSAAARVVRYVMSVPATPTEARSPVVVGYVLNSSSTPTARGFLDSLLKGIRDLPLFSAPVARPGGAGVDLGAGVCTAPAATPDGAGDDYGSGVSSAPADDHRAIKWVLLPRAPSVTSPRAQAGSPRPCLLFGSPALAPSRPQIIGVGPRDFSSSAIVTQMASPSRPEVVQITGSSRAFSSSGMGTQMSATDVVPRLNLDYLIAFLDGVVLSAEDELAFRKAFNEKCQNFKVADVINHFTTEQFTFEECCFLLKILHAKLGSNWELARLAVEEAVELSASNEEIAENPVICRVEVKMDVANKAFHRDLAEILKFVRGSTSTNKEWGTVDVYGKKLDLTKLEFLKKVIEYFMGL